jgi:NAD-dependent DNA ligase
MKNFLAYAAAKYEAGQPIITDAEFDRLVKIHGYEKVGAGVDPSKAIPHHSRMYSLQKCFVGEKLIQLPGEVVESPKLDGAAVSLLYAEGKLVLALTRGDGKAGLDITNKMAWLVEHELDQSYTGQIEGEVVAPKEIPNARNYAAGALNLKDFDTFTERNLEFVAYGMKPSMHKSYIADLDWLSHVGEFATILDDKDFLDRFPQDGKVFRVNDNETYNSLGFTNKHPRGAFALKEIQEGVVTILNDVIWQVGRSGVVAPVAILQPVKVGDATVSRATLHNMKYIDELGLELGCEVEIIRSGEIIPRVVRRI